MKQTDWVRIMRRDAARSAARARALTTFRRPGVEGYFIVLLVALALTLWAWKSGEGVVITFAVIMWLALVFSLKNELWIRKHGHCQGHKP